MTELGEVLGRLGLRQYLGVLQNEGFERWETVLDITEQDLAFMNFKLGHRRILQREIASARGMAATQALTSAQFGSVDDEMDEKSVQKVQKLEHGKGSTPTGKRKYRRHPKADENAPDKPPSAYVMFANRVRDDLKGQNLSFTDIAKLVGEKWKVLPPEEKEQYEYQASVAKDKYNTEFDEYKTTVNYKEYSRYLAEFKSKANKEVKEVPEQVDASQKRQRLDTLMYPTSPSSTSSMGGCAASPSSAGKQFGRPSNITGHSASYASPLQKPVSPTPASPSHRPTVSHPLSPPGQSTVAIDFAPQDVSTPTTMHPNNQDGSFYPRIHPIQTPHIQQQSSYLRHQPTGSRSIVLPTPGIRRAGTDAFSPLSVSGSISSSGSSSLSMTPMTPSISNSMDDNPRSNRALPPPAAPGYFDRAQQFQHHQRTVSSPQSPLPYSAPEPIHPQPGQHSPLYSTAHNGQSPTPKQQQLVPLYGAGITQSSSRAGTPRYTEYPEWNRSDRQE